MKTNVAAAAVIGKSNAQQSTTRIFTSTPNNSRQRTEITSPLFRNCVGAVEAADKGGVGVGVTLTTFDPRLKKAALFSGYTHHWIQERHSKHFRQQKSASLHLGYLCALFSGLLVTIFMYFDF
ncbi:GL10520 [Drosophila persimilis]|uniref:GL10520 n=1 Tax=Drosophila persimilis TaxID=7234 RepID=B4GBG5_DROPE|nr:GL10520 [Drosophila persimilis]